MWALHIKPSQTSLELTIAVFLAIGRIEALLAGSRLDGNFLLQEGIAIALEIVLQIWRDQGAEEFHVHASQV